MKVSLISTAKDAGAGNVAEFLASIRAQTRPPDEVVIVDGGSTDGTLEALRGAAGVTVISEPGAGIARGRNVAIQAATHDVIACSDADCVLDPDWLARLLEPIESGADVVAGFYRPIAATFLQECAAAVAVPEPDEVGPGWMPSSRSIAFRRAAWEAAGRYPDWLEVGEDMYFNHHLVASGARIENAVGAVAGWRVRPTLAGTWRQYAGYAMGDARAGMYPERHALRFATYALLGAALGRRRRWLLAATALGGAAYARTPMRRAWRRIDDPAGRAGALVAVPLLMAFVDAAKMWGYARGLLGQVLHEVEED